MGLFFRFDVVKLVLKWSSYKNRIFMDLLPVDFHLTNHRAIYYHNPGIVTYHIIVISISGNIY